MTSEYTSIVEESAIVKDFLDESDVIEEATNSKPKIDDEEVILSNNGSDESDQPYGVQ